MSVGHDLKLLNIIFTRRILSAFKDSVRVNMAVNYSPCNLGDEAEVEVVGLSYTVSCSSLTNTVSCRFYKAKCSIQIKQDKGYREKS